MNDHSILVSAVTSNGVTGSEFSELEIRLTGDEQRRLSEQIAAVNFRLRTSSCSYKSGFHVAGDPTLLIVLAGCIRITLRAGDHRDFSMGQMFVAQDYLADGVKFSPEIHGHRAEVIGEEGILAVHVKLSRR